MAARPGIITRAARALRYTITGVDNAFMSPQQPLAPMQQDTQGRRRDYPVAINLNYLPRSTERIGFDRLKGLANGCNLLRIIIERQKDFLEAFEWSVMPREAAHGKRPAASKYAAQIKDVTDLFKYPDQEHDWAQWMRAIFDECFITDATSIYVWPDRGGKPWAFRQIDGSTVKPLIDQFGFRPVSPDPAYQQIIKGIPASDYTGDELVYYPKNVRVGYDYGFPPVEQIIMTVETEIARASEQLSYFATGNMNRGLLTGPAEWTTQQIRDWQTYWDGLFEGNIQNKARGWWVPDGTKWQEISAPPLKDEFDEWLARIICYAFSTSPMPFVKSMNRGNMESQQEVAEEGGIATYMAWFKRLMDRLIHVYMGYPDLEFSWSEDREFDPAVADKIADDQVRSGRKTIDEARDMNGDAPLPDGLGAVPLIFTAQGAITLDSVINPPEQEPMPAGVAQPGALPFAKLAPDDPELLLPPNQQDLDQNAQAEARRKREEELATLLIGFLGRVRITVYQLVAEELAPIAAPTEADVARIVAQAIAVADSDLEETVRTVTAALEATSRSAAQIGLHQAFQVLGLDAFQAASREAAIDVESIIASAAARGPEMFGMQDVAGEIIADPHAAMDITRTTETLVRKLVTDAIADGKAVSEISDLVEGSWAFSDGRAALIARNETNEAWNATLFDIFDQTGVSMVGWQTMEDVKVEIECLLNQAAGPIPIGQPFPSGAKRPLQHNLCRCWLYAVK